MDYLQISDGQYTKTIYTMVRKLLIVSGTYYQKSRGKSQTKVARKKIVMFVISGGISPAWGVLWL